MRVKDWKYVRAYLVCLGIAALMACAQTMTRDGAIEGEYSSRGLLDDWSLPADPKEAIVQSTARVGQVWDVAVAVHASGLITDEQKEQVRGKVLEALDGIQKAADAVFLADGVGPVNVSEPLAMMDTLAQVALQIMMEAK